MDKLAKPERSESFGADRVLGFEGTPIDVGDEKKRQRRRFFDASHREHSELGEICTLECLTKMLPAARVTLDQTESSRMSQVLDSLTGRLLTRSGGLLAFRPSLILSRRNYFC